MTALGLKYIQPAPVTAMRGIADAEAQGATARGVA